MNGNKRAIKLNEFIAHGSNVTSCTLGHKSNRLAATGGDDKKVNLWTLNKPTCIMSLTGHTSSIQSISFSSNEDKIVSGSTSGTVKVWDLECNKQLCNLSGHKSSVTCLEYHTYADYIASGSVDSQIRLWDLRRKGCIFTYKGHTNSVNSLKFSPDSKWIASVSDDCLIKIWDLKAGRLLIDLKGHQSAVNSLEFHPNEFLLATGSSDRSVKFWDLEKMECVCTSPSSPSAIKVIQFEPNGKCLFTASTDYLQSISWEPSEIYDSVYCQWKLISDMCISSNKLIASSFYQNMVSFYAVDLMQVAPIGVPSSSVNNDFSNLNPSLASSSLNNYSKLNQISSNNTHRKNFRHSDQIETSIQQSEEMVQSNSSDTNDQSNIFNQEEYNKIFKPKKEISRPENINQNPSSSIQEPKKSVLNNNNNLIKKINNNENNEQNKSEFFIDIRTPNYPPPPVQNKQPHSARIPSSNNLLDNNIIPSVVSQSVSIPSHKPPAPDNNDINVFNFKEKLKINEENNIKIEKEKKELEKIGNNNEDEIDLINTIEFGHDAFIKALKSRYKNLQSICVMWNSGNIKSALDHATNLKDNSLMADILNEINSINNLWNLDICTILLPSIKDLINSKYEEHMVIGSESCKLVFKNFGKLIKSNLLSAASVGVGVDISREERQSKCRSCYNNFVDIVSIIEKKLPLISSTKLINNFREINLLMKTIE